MPPLSDWLSWELWTTAISAVLSGPWRLAAWIWAGYVANRDNLVPLATFLGAGAIAWAALRQAKTATLRHAEQTRADRERRITESFAKAVEQLGSDKLETRLGGIYTLERIARESEREYWPIMETLTAYVREHAPWPPRQVVVNPFVEFQGSSGGETAGESTPAEKPENAAERASVKVRPATDIQAILTVLGRRDEQARKQDEAAERSIDLAGTNLRGANLLGAHLEGAFLSGAHLERANLVEAHLENADLRQAHLDGANLVGVYLEGAYFFEAHLAGARFVGAHMAGADLRRAHLGGANLGAAYLVRANLGAAYLVRANLSDAYLGGAEILGAHLDGAFLARVNGLTQEQLNGAYGDEATTLPEDPNLRPPAHWSATTPNDRPDAPDNAG